MTRIGNWTKAMGLLFAATVLAVALGACGDDDPKPPDWSVGEVIDFKDKGVLAEVQTSFGPLKILRVQGTHYEMGYQYGYLMADHIQDAVETVFQPLMGEELGMDPELALDMFGGLADQAWNHAAPYLPADFQDELDGVLAGVEDSGHPDPEYIVAMIRRITILLENTSASAFGDDIGPMTRFFTDGYSTGYEEYFQLADAEVDFETMEQQLALRGIYAPKVYRDRLLRRMGTAACSFFSVWGEHTTDGRQLASRVLDFTADIGLGTIGLITVFVPDGGAAHVSIGYVGMLTILSGMNEHGLAIGAIASTSTLDRIKTRSVSARARQMLEFAHDLDEAEPYFLGTGDDDAVMAPSVGVVAMLTWGDPEGGGAGAEALATEFNGVFASVHRNGPSPGCEREAFLYEFDHAGDRIATYNHIDHPMQANLEEDAFEIDRDGTIRTFLVDANQEFVYDATTGQPIDDPQGEPIRVGYPMDCGVYRADTAMNYMVRRYQLAANGPADPDRTNILAHQSNPYKKRYISQYDSIMAFREGTSFEWEGVEVFPDNGGAERKIDVEAALDLIWVAADDSDNIYSVLFDTTNLVIYVAYESGTGASWTPAQDNEYLELRLSDLLPADRQ